MNRDGRPARGRRAARFAFLWAMLGFATGTVTLLGPVRWVTAAMRRGEVGQGTEDLAVRAIILLLLAGTGYAAFRLSRRPARRPDGGRSRVLPASTALAALALVLWLNPSLLTGEQEMPERGGERFVFGPYPSEEELRELKDEGFDGVVTLLHPAVAPFEPKLLADERVAARAAGIELIETPMLPWVSSNESSLEKIRALAAAGSGRYYVHCYLGKDRVNVVRRLLASIDPSLTSAAPASARHIAAATRFERGAIVHFPDSVHVTPFPTEEEWFGQVLNGTVQQVVSLLDPGNPEDVPWLEMERRMAAQYRVPLAVLPVQAFPFDPDSVLAIAERVRSLPRTVVVHGFVSGSPAVEGFVRAYATRLPPLAPSLFREPLGGGAVEVIGPNLAVGPRPAGPEWGGYLHPRGVRSAIYLGDAGAAAARADAAIARSGGVEWRALSPTDAALPRTVSAGGPWYLYGPGTAAARPRLER